MTVYNAKSIIIQSLPVLLFAVFLSIYSGTILESNTEQLKHIPILLFVLPSFINTCGDISALIASRLTTAMYLGRMKPKFKADPILTKNTIAGLLLILLSSLLISIIAHFLAPVFGITSPGLIKTVLIVVSAALLTQIIMLALAVLIAVYTFNKNLDPDNFTAPLLTTLGDLVGVYILMAVSKLVGG